MPWKIESRNGKYCVVRKPDGKVEKCHDSRGEAQDHMAALYANTGHKDLGNESPILKELERQSDIMPSVTGFTVKQDGKGTWHWLGVVSNNWLDKHFEWISTKAHKRFVEMIDKGEFGPLVLSSWLVDLPGKIGTMFKEIGERGTPDLWYWHLPVPIGYAYLVAYDDRGYLIAAGQQKEGEFYSSVFKTISETNIQHGMSHGMPDVFIERSSANKRIIDGYLSTEFTALPDDEAANFGTTFSANIKEAVMQIPKNKSSRMTEVFGEETVARFDALLGELEIFAEDSEIPRKEKQAMSDQTTADAQVEEAEVEEVETEEVEAEETEVEEADAVQDTVAESEAESDDEESDEEVETGMAMDPAKFQVPTDFKAFAKEIAEGLKEVMTDFQAAQDARFKTLEKQLEDQRAELAKLRDSDAERIAAKAAETPIASMAGWLATEVGSVIGKDAARIHGNEDRALYNKTKVGESEEQASVPGVPSSIAAMIQRQRGRGRVVRVPTAVDGQ